MLDFNWDDQGELAVYVRAPDGRQICVEAMERKGAEPTGEYLLATHVDRRTATKAVIVGDSDILPGVKAGTRLVGVESIAYVEKLAELQRSCPQIAVNDQQEKLRDHDIREGLVGRWEAP